LRYFAFRRGLVHYHPFNQFSLVAGHPYFYIIFFRPLHIFPTTCPHTAILYPCFEPVFIQGGIFSVPNNPLPKDEAAPV
jgi:hypothetical protein